MYGIERQEQILAILREKKSCSVTELAATLNYSTATVRRDLNILAKELKVRKTFGGAVIIEQFSTELPATIRKSENIDAKKKLCAAASSFITDNMTLFLAASTTVECIVPLLLGYKNLTVITNSPDIPKMLIGSNINVYSTGGKFLHHSNAYVGEFARNVIRSFNADLLFFSASGVTENGKITVLTGDDDIQKTMIENAAKTCFLFDHTKFGKTYRHTICTLRDVDIVITDKEISSLPNANNIIIAR